MKRKQPSQVAGPPRAAGEAGFVAFYWRNVKVMADAIGRILPPHEVEDVLQKAFLKVFRLRSRLPDMDNDIDNEAGWAKVIAVNAALDHLKSRRRVQAREVAVDVDSASGVADLAAVLDAKRQLAAIAAGLTPEQLLLLELFVDGGASGASEVLGIPAASVRRKIHGVRSRVRAWLFDRKEGETP